MTLNTEVTIGNLITCISVLVSIIAICYAWIKERKLKIRTNANLIRNAAAKTLKGVERWKELTLSISYKCESYFVETSEMLSEKKIIEESELERARDFLWKRLMSIIEDNKNQILIGDLRNYYFDMFKYAPDIRQHYDTAVFNLEKAENEMIIDFIEINTQQTILNVNTHIQEEYYSAILGNQLRFVRNDCMDKYREALESSIKEIKEILIEIIKEPDEKLIRYSHVYTDQKL